MLRGVNSSPLLGVALAALAGVSTAITAEGQSPPQILNTVRLEVTEVADSSGYLVYRYNVVNPASSHGGVAGVELDLSAPRGTGHVAMPFTGALGPSRKDVPDHVPFGGIAPERWSMLVDYKARLAWYVAAILPNDESAPVSFDSVGAGAERGGFGVRSPYLPGVREFAAIPTEQSCCTKPNPQGELPSAFSFRVRGFTVAPTYGPDEMTLQVIRDLLGRICGELRWISQEGVCKSLRARLDAGGLGEAAGRREQLQAFLQELDARHDAANKPVSNNAYWLLKVNGEFLLSHM
jgi:hypothetical protein